jgi:hypothetical protein
LVAPSNKSLLGVVDEPYLSLAIEKIWSPFKDIPMYQPYVAIEHHHMATEFFLSPMGYVDSQQLPFLKSKGNFLVTN